MANELIDFKWNGRIKLYTTCPQSKDWSAADYLDRVVEVARWSDSCAGMLIYSDNSIIDPWLVAQTVLQATKSLSPLVAIQPLYMHPYAAAKMVASLAFLHNRRLALNMIAGGFKNDLVSLCDPVSHDNRYARLIEYTEIMRGLLSGTMLTTEGESYQVRGLRLTPSLPPELMPTILMSGSSSAGRGAAMAVGAVGVEYPEPPDSTTPVATMPEDYERGIRIGIIAASSDKDAWEIAEERFPPNRRGQLERQMATKISDSSWHHQLSQKHEQRGAYSLGPFQNGYTSCPYLIGSFATVSDEIVRYLRMGYTTFVLDIPKVQLDVGNAIIAFHLALINSPV